MNDNIKCNNNGQRKRRDKYGVKKKREITQK